MIGQNCYVPSKKPLQIPKIKLGNLQGPFTGRYHLASSLLKTKIPPYGGTQIRNFSFTCSASATHFVVFYGRLPYCLSQSALSKLKFIWRDTKLIIPEGGKRFIIGLYKKTLLVSTLHLRKLQDKMMSSNI